MDWSLLKIMITAIVTGAIGVYFFVETDASNLDVWPLLLPCFSGPLFSSAAVPAQAAAGTRWSVCFAWSRARASSSTVSTSLSLSGGVTIPAAVR